MRTEAELQRDILAELQPHPRTLHQLLYALEERPREVLIAVGMLVLRGKVRKSGHYYQLQGNTPLSAVQRAWRESHPEEARDEC